MTTEVEPRRRVEHFFFPCTLWTVNAERRMHYHERANRVRQVRQDAKLLVMAQRDWHWGETSISLQVQPQQANRGPLADWGAYMPVVKAVIDGMVDARVIPNDTPEFLTGVELLVPVRAPSPREVGLHVWTIHYS